MGKLNLSIVEKYSAQLVEKSEEEKRDDLPWHHMVHVLALFVFFLRLSGCSHPFYSARRTFCVCPRRSGVKMCARMLANRDTRYSNNAAAAALAVDVYLVLKHETLCSWLNIVSPSPSNVVSFSVLTIQVKLLDFFMQSVFVWVGRELAINSRFRDSFWRRWFALMVNLLSCEVVFGFLKHNIAETKANYHANWLFFERFLIFISVLLFQLAADKGTFLARTRLFVWFVVAHILG